MIPVAYCRSCGRTVLWVTLTPSGKRTPLDAEPTPAGTVIITDTAPPTGRVLTKPEVGSHPGVPRYVSHFATCPQAKQWRKSP